MSPQRIASTVRREVPLLRDDECLRDAVGQIIEIDVPALPTGQSSCTTACSSTVSITTTGYGERPGSGHARLLTTVLVTRPVSRAPKRFLVWHGERVVRVPPKLFVQVAERAHLRQVPQHSTLATARRARPSPSWGPVLRNDRLGDQPVGVRSRVKLAPEGRSAR